MPRNFLNTLNVGLTEFESNQTLINNNKPPISITTKMYAG